MGSPRSHGGRSSASPRSTPTPGSASRGVGEPYEGWVALDLPSYTAMFGSLATYVRLATPLSGGAAADAAAVVDALRAGRSFSAVTGIAPIGQLTFEAESGGRRATMGEQLVPQGPVHVRFAADVPTGAQTQLVCDGDGRRRGAGRPPGLDVRRRAGRVPGRGAASRATAG